MKLLQELNWGGQRHGNQFVPISREQIFQQLLQYMQNKNNYEKARCGEIKLQTEDYIEYAHLKKKIYGDNE